MPELFGVFSQGADSGDVAHVFDVLRASLTGFRGGDIQSANLGWAMVGVLTYHRNEECRLRKDNETREVSLCLGGLGAFDAGTGPSRVGWPLLKAARTNGRLWYPPFAVCALRENPRESVVLCDRHGLQPIFYTKTNGLLLISTKYLPLLHCRRTALGSSSIELEQRAILDLFTFEHLTGCSTLVKNVSVLSGGFELRICPLGVRVEPAFEEESPTEVQSSTRGLAETAAEFHQRLNSAVATLVEKHERVGVTLSGGLDSRALLGCALQTPANLTAFTFGNPATRDVRFSSELAWVAQVPHRLTPIDSSYVERWLEHGIHVTGGMVSCVHYHILALAQLLEEEVDLVLDGLGGDALTGGHLTAQMLFARSKETCARLLFLQRATVCRDEAEMRSLFTEDFINSVKYRPIEAVLKHFDEVPSGMYWLGCHRFDLHERQRRFIQFGPHQIRPFTGVATPFYAPEVFDFLRSQPRRFLLGQSLYKKMQTKHLENLARVPESTRGVPLSWPRSLRFVKRVADAVRRRAPNTLDRLMGPLNEGPATSYPAWFRSDLRQYLLERLLQDNHAMHAIISRRAIEATLREHFAGAVNHKARIGCLLTLATFIDESEAP